MQGLDLVTPLNALIAGLGGLLLVMLTFFAHQWMEQQKRKHAEHRVEAAITEGVALAAITEPVPEKRAAVAADYVATIAPKEIELLKVGTPVLEEKIKARAASSRGIVF